MSLTLCRRKQYEHLSKGRHTDQSQVRSLYYYAISGRSQQVPQLLGFRLPFKILPCSSGAECEVVQCQPISEVRSLS
jgi:hypothetical protein